MGYVNAGNAKTLQNLVNSGDVICSGEAKQDCYIGGCVGYVVSRNALYTLTNLTNNAARVRLNSSVAENLYIGGVVGATDDVDGGPYTLGANSVVEIGGGASVGGEIFQTDEYIGYADEAFISKTLSAN